MTGASAPAAAEVWAPDWILWERKRASCSSRNSVHWLTARVGRKGTRLVNQSLTLTPLPSTHLWWLWRLMLRQCTTIARAHWRPHRHRHWHWRARVRWADTTSSCHCSPRTPCTRIWTTCSAAAWALRRPPAATAPAPRCLRRPHCLRSPRCQGQWQRLTMPELWRTKRWQRRRQRRVGRSSRASAQRPPTLWPTRAFSSTHATRSRCRSLTSRAAARAAAAAAAGATSGPRRPPQHRRPVSSLQRLMLSFRAMQSLLFSEAPRHLHHTFCTIYQSSSPFHSALPNTLLYCTLVH